MSFADVDGDGKPELLLGQRNFIRAVVLREETAPAGTNTHASYAFQVKDQINGRSSNSRITGAASIVDEHNMPTLFLLDADQKAITVCQRDASGVWRVARNIPLPASRRRICHRVQLWRSGLAVEYSGAERQRRRGLDAFERNLLEPQRTRRLRNPHQGRASQRRRDGRLFQQQTQATGVPGDRSQLRGYRGLRSRTSPASCRSTGGKVFEERTFRSRRSELPEPREALVEDVTGDGKKDLILLVHDRVLVYPQE